MRKGICLLLVFLIGGLLVVPSMAAPEGPEITQSTNPTPSASDTPQTPEPALAELPWWTSILVGVAAVVIGVITAIALIKKKS